MLLVCFGVVVGVSSDPAVQLIANHLPLHGEYRAGNVGCTCGWEAFVQVDPIADDLDQFKTETFAAHVVAAIRDSGYTVIALPEAHNTWAGRSEWLRSADPDNRVGWCTWTSPGHRVMLQRAEPELTPDEAADLGAALIAAAKHAGDTQ